MPTMLLTVEYDGSHYHGWQRQKGQNTIQQTLEERLVRFLEEPVRVSAAGRTDAGVHAVNQYVSFVTNRVMPERAYVLGFNHFLPDDIRVKAARAMPDGFHASYDAKRKTYRYRILNRDEPTAIDHARCWHVWGSVDIDKMNAAAAIITGTHDFSSFRASLCSRRTTTRTVYEARWSREGAWLLFTITASGFLHNMVRILVGTMVDVGRNRLSVDEFRAILAARDRKRSGDTAPPQGLYLLDVYY